LNIHTIKPLDVDILAKAARETGAIVTAEEHSVIGGLGGAVCEALCGVCPAPVLRVGVEDTFGASGPAVEMLKAYGLDAANIVAKAKQAIAMKG
jgi:transketolase